MLKANYHPGWCVEVDGRAVEPVMVAPAYVAAPVEAGAHRVRFDYRASPLRLPLLLGALLAGLALVALRRRG